MVHSAFVGNEWRTTSTTRQLVQTENNRLKIISECAVCKQTRPANVQSVAAREFAVPNARVCDCEFSGRFMFLISTNSQFKQLCGKTEAWICELMLDRVMLLHDGNVSCRHSIDAIGMRSVTRAGAHSANGLTKSIPFLRTVFRPMCESAVSVYIELTHNLHIPPVCLIASPSAVSLSSSLSCKHLPLICSQLLQNAFHLLELYLLYLVLARLFTRFVKLFIIIWLSRASSPSSAVS